MPPLDHATLQAVLDKQGMPNTTENLNRIAQFAAVAPDMLEKYLGRGTDQARVDAGGGTNAAIDRSIASTADPRLAQLAGPNPYSATLDPNTGLTNIGPGLVKGGGERQGSVTVGQPRLAGIPGDENRPVGAPPFAKPAPSGQITESEMNRPGVDPRVAPTQAGETQPAEGGSWTNFIAPSILALFATQMARRGGGAHVPPGTTPPISGAIPAPTPAPTISGGGRTPQVAPAPISPDAQRPNVQAPVAGSPAVPLSEPSRSSPAGRPSGQSQADIERMKAEVAAENARGETQLRQSIKTKAQLDAEETARKARESQGRK
jgi:hypothetical protein